MRQMQNAEMQNAEVRAFPHFAFCVLHFAFNE
jgi:hypothetical protein